MLIIKCVEPHTYRLVDKSKGYDVRITQRPTLDKQFNRHLITLPEDCPVPLRTFNVDRFDETRDTYVITPQGGVELPRYEDLQPKPKASKQTPEQKLAYITDYLDEADKQVFFATCWQGHTQQSQGGA